MAPNGANLWPNSFKKILTCGQLRSTPMCQKYVRLVRIFFQSFVHVQANSGGQVFSHCCRHLIQIINLYFQLIVTNFKHFKHVLSYLHVILLNSLISIPNGSFKIYRLFECMFFVSFAYLLLASIKQIYLNYHDLFLQNV